MKNLVTTILGLLLLVTAQAQNSALPFYQIPDAPTTYTSGTVAARMVDGLGFRYYWATEGLRPADLNYAPGNDTRTCQETLVHIYEMSFIILRTTAKQVFEVGSNPKPTDFATMRRITLENLQAASANLRAATDADMPQMNVVIRGSNGTTQLPFWNIVNGPIADCLWHVGQVVSFRRASGNPFNEKVSVLMGRLRE